MGHDHARGDELAKLVDEEQLDAVVAAVTLEEIAEAWHCYHRRHPNNDDDPDWWAVEFWLTIGYEHEDVLRAGLLALVALLTKSILVSSGQVLSKPSCARRRVGSGGSR